MRRAVLLLLLLLLPAGLAAQQPLPLGQSSPQGTTPVPDPTLLTTLAQEKASAALRELLDAKIAAVADELKRQKTAMDAADARAIVRLDDIPTVIDKALLHLQKLMEEKFRGVDQQFAGRDVALAAALLAQKTSVDEQNKANAASSAKAEGATTKQIDGITSIILANGKATDEKVDSVKTLLMTQDKSVNDKITEIRNTIADLRTSLRVSDTAVLTRGSAQSDLWGYLIGGAGLLIAFMAFLLPKLSSPPPPPYYPPPYQQAPPTIVSPAVIPVAPVRGN